jgi:uncharacterized protein (TIGR02145 family)
VASQDICPTGWHLPSDWEWNNLEKEITTGYVQYSTASTAPTTWSDDWRTYYGNRGGHGMLMRNPKNTSTSYTQSPAGMSNPKEKGFNALLVGMAAQGEWHNYGQLNGFTTSTSFAAGTNAIRVVPNVDAWCQRAGSSKHLLWSVRCKKDE